MKLLVIEDDKDIVDYIINYISPAANDKVADISCGSGAFILGAIKYYRNKFGKKLSDILRDNIYGADILPYNVERAKLLITLYALSIGEHIDVDNINIINVDSLKHNWAVEFDAIIGNPPYVKFQDLEDDTREYLLNNWETTKFGTFNLYFAFFEVTDSGYYPGKMVRSQPPLYFWMPLSHFRVTPSHFWIPTSHFCLPPSHFWVVTEHFCVTSEHFRVPLMHF